MGNRPVGLAAPSTPPLRTPSSPALTCRPRTSSTGDRAARSILQIAHHLLNQQTKYREPGSDHFDRHGAERFKRRASLHSSASATRSPLHLFRLLPKEGFFQRFP